MILGGFLGDDMIELKFEDRTIGRQLEGDVLIHYGPSALELDKDFIPKLDKWIDTSVLTRCVHGSIIRLHRCFHPEWSNK